MHGPNHTWNMSRLLRFMLPAAVLILLITGCNHEPNVTEMTIPGSGGEKVYLLTQADGSNSNDADLIGVLQLVDGCLQIKHEATPVGDAYAIIWPEGFDIAFDGATVLVLDRNNRVVTRVGERTLLGGSGHRGGPETLSDCREPFWSSGPEIYTGDRIPSAFD